MAEEWVIRQKAAIADQKARHAAVANGTEPVPAADEGPLARYNRAQSLDYIAQLQNCIDADAFLPTAGEHGLTFDPGQERGKLDDQTRKDYAALVTKLTADGNYTIEELVGAASALQTNLANGVSLDPATAESV